MGFVLWFFVLLLVFILYIKSHILGIIGLIVALISFVIYVAKRKDKIYQMRQNNLIQMQEQEYFQHLQNYKNIEIGIPIENMIAIMGEDYSKSLLQDNIEVYKYGMPKYNMFVDISVKDGKVFEVKPFNM